jgi:predicted RNase H-like HicB family nuclease
MSPFLHFSPVLDSPQAQLYFSMLVPPIPSKESKMKFRVIIEQDEDGVFVAEVPALPGCISQGETRAEALKNIQEAIEAYLESLKAHDEPVPPSISEEIVEVAV